MFQNQCILWPGAAWCGGASKLGLGPVLGISLAPVTGTRATAGTAGIESTSRVIDMSDTIHLLDPNTAPLTAITMKLRKAKAISPEVKWHEDDYLPTLATVNDTIAGGAATEEVVVTDATFLRVGDIIKSLGADAQTLVVTASDQTLTTTMGTIDGTNMAAIADGALLLVIGNRNAEGAASRTIISTQKTQITNYTQIFRKPFGVTRTLQNSEIYGGDDLAYQSRKHGIEHRIDIERAYLFGEKNETTSGAQAVRTCQGIISRITQVTTLVNVTAALFETFLNTGFRYGPARKMLFASRLWVSSLNGIARASIETIPSSKKFPLALTEYVSGHGKCYIVTHNLLEHEGANNDAYIGWALLLDMDSIYHRYLQNSDTRVKTNIQQPDEDQRKDEYLTECCPMLIQEKNHSLWRNMSTFS